jgi:hypothetical protein
MFGYIYLLQTRESRKLNEQIFKIGRTEQYSLDRFYNYPKGSKLLLHIECFDSVTVERDLIKSFEETFTKVEQYGYFKGDPEDMKVLICSSLNLPYNIVKAEIEYNIG